MGNLFSKNNNGGPTSSTVAAAIADSPPDTPVTGSLQTAPAKEVESSPPAEPLSSSSQPPAAAAAAAAGQPQEAIKAEHHEVASCSPPSAPVTEADPHPQQKQEAFDETTFAAESVEHQATVQEAAAAAESVVQEPPTAADAADNSQPEPVQPQQEHVEGESGDGKGPVEDDCTGVLVESAGDGTAADDAVLVSVSDLQVDLGDPTRHCNENEMVITGCHGDGEQLDPVVTSSEPEVVITEDAKKTAEGQTAEDAVTSHEEPATEEQQLAANGLTEPEASTTGDSAQQPAAVGDLEELELKTKQLDIAPAEPAAVDEMTSSSDIAQ